MIRTISRTSNLTIGRVSAALMATASTLAFATPALANDVLFSTHDVSFESGARMTQVSGLTQLRFDNGATVSFVDTAEYRINEDGTLDLYAGSVTVSGGDGPTLVRMPEGVQGQVLGKMSAARFSVGGDGKSTGHVLTGSAQVGRIGKFRRFSEGEMFEVGNGGEARQVLANDAQVTPGSSGDQNGGVFAMGGDAGPVAAAQNGIPVALGDALAAVGASGDIAAAARRVEAAAANPSIETFPVGDLRLLVALAGNIGTVYGGRPFDGAQADIIRTYLQFLANGGAGQNFLSAYSGFLVQYLDLIRSGAAPSGFELASLDQINSFIAFTDRTAGFGTFSSQDRALVDAYLAFIREGGNADAFSGTFTDLTAAYFAFIRSGGNPSDFTDATQSTLDAYIAFLQNSGLVNQLSAADRALIAAYLENGGLAFAGEYRAALDAYFAYLSAGNLPSDYTALDQATILAYLATLEGTGLLDSVLGDNADFYASYLAFLQGGGQVDAFAGLNANIFASYANALNLYYDFLVNGGVPSSYDALTQEQIAAFIAALENAGATDRFLTDLADFYTAYFAFLSDGGNPDAFSGLPVPPDFPAFAAALNAYAVFLQGGGLPADYTAEQLATLQNYLEAIESSGELATLLGSNADLLNSYFTYLAGGGTPNGFTGLPIYVEYVAALNAYYAFLLDGGTPSDYVALDLAILEAYLDALDAAGGLAAFANLNAFFIDYYEFVRGGGQPDQFAGLPGGTGGGGNGPVTGSPTEFTATANLTGYVVSPSLRGRLSNLSGSVDNAGAFSGSSLRPGTATSREIGGDAKGIVGRYSGGTFSFDDGQSFIDIPLNSGVHYAVMAPIVGDLPTSGTIDYSILAATNPTYSDGSTVPGSLAANLTIGFGSALTFGIDGTITMPDATYNFTTPGRASGNLVAPQVGSADFLVLRPALTGVGTACGSQQDCFLNMFGGFGGSDPQNRVGFSYETVDRFNLGGTSVQGAVLFGEQGTDGSGGSSGGGAPTEFNFQPNQIVAYAFEDTGLDVREIAEAAFDAGGRPIAYVATRNDFTQEHERPTIGSASIAEGGAIGTTIGWGRWTNGTTGGRFFANEDGFTFGPNQGLHIVAGDVPTNLPSSGTVDYTLAGATAPTVADGSIAPGSFSGTLSVAFGSTPTASFDFAVAIGNADYSFGAQDRPIETSGDFAYSFGANMMAVSGTGSVCPTGSCTANMRGFLAGEGASAVGVSYNFVEAGNDALRVSGAAAFSSQASASSSQLAALVTHKPGVPIMRDASSEWSRWSGPRNDLAIGAEGLAPTADGTMQSRIPTSAAEATEMLGGLVTFGGGK